MICRSWREVALSTPALWNGIHVFLPRFLPRYSSSSDYISTITRKKEGLKRWLERSGSLPLTIWIAILFPSDLLVAVDDRQLTEDVGILEDVLRLIATYSRKWRSITFLADRRRRSLAIWKPIAELQKEDLPQLQEIHAFNCLSTFSSVGQQPPVVPSPIASLVTSSDSLRTLDVLNVHSISTFLDLQIRWTSLKELTLRSGDQIDPSFVTSKVAALCPSLVSFNLGLASSSASSTPQPSFAVQWPHLQKFDLTIHDRNRDHLNKRLSNAFWRVFHSMTAPALTHLSLEAQIDRMGSELGQGQAAEPTEPISHLPFENMISKSGCTLSHLSLSGVFLMSEAALTSALHLLPSLTSLTLTDCTNSVPASHAPMGCDPDIPHHKLTSCLVSISSSPNLCPDIAELSISGCYVENIESIVSFAKARSHKLKRLSVNFGVITGERVEVIKQFMSPADLHDLREERGIKVDWKWKEWNPKDGKIPVFDRPYTIM
ncbi:hypothetical protein V5O48_008688 [Marasmius crinis-equi]|uniref:F-box domain-containing protein n=1 Tax=Marasmius crinis-equi TaxID=585013 RepID=A0ABR3FD86_9AGAR